MNTLFTSRMYLFSEIFTSHGMRSRQGEPRLFSGSPLAVGRRMPDFRIALSSLCLPYHGPGFPRCRAYGTALPFPGPTNAPCRAAAGCGQVRGPSAPVSSASVSPSVPPFSIRICSTAGADTVRIAPCVCAGASMAAASDLFRAQPSDHSFHPPVKGVS